LEGGIVRNLLALVGLVVVGFAGVGYYLNWYHFSWLPGKDGKQQINVEFDTKKIGADGQKGLDQVGEFTKDKLRNEKVVDSSEFVGPPEREAAKLITPPIKR
jgi:hypothetical protein